MHQGRAITLCLAILALLGGCAQTPERPPPMRLDCAQLQSVPDDVPAYLRPPTQVVELYAADGGTYRWNKKRYGSTELQNALVAESGNTRITEVHLLSGGQSISIGHLFKVAGIAKALCVPAMVERGGELQKINYR
jgi:hypothetical protein